MIASIAACAALPGVLEVIEHIDRTFDVEAK